MLLTLLPQKYQVFADHLPEFFTLALALLAAIGSLGSVIEFIGMRCTWPKWIAIGKKFEAIGTDFPKLLNDNVRPLLVRLGVKGLVVLLLWCGALIVGLSSCAGAKPCPISLQAQYVAELVEACGDAGSVEACGDAGAEVTARHEAAQLDAGCRVK